MSGYKALLIGIDEYVDASLNFDDVIQRDFNELTAVLKSVGYKVESYRGQQTYSKSNQDLEDIISDFFDAADDDDTLLIYLSGHGVHLTDNTQSENYLVPSTVRLDKPETFSQRFLKLNFEPNLDASLAKNAIVFVDACREWFDIGTKSINRFLVEENQIRQNENQRYLIVFGCTQGEKAAYINEDEQKFSLMAKAFAEVLRNEKYDTGIKSVLEATSRELSRLCKHLNKKEQQLCYRTESFFSSAGLDTIPLFLSKNAISKTENPWREAVEYHEFWEDLQNKDGDFYKAGKEATLALVDACWTDFQHAKQTLASNPWWDEHYPQRVLERLSELHSQRKKSMTPGLAEVMLMLVTPFVRESLFAQELLRFSNLEMTRISESFVPENETEERIEAVVKTYSPLVRKIEHLLKTDMAKPANSVAWWLFYKATIRSVELWQLKPSSSLFQAINGLSLANAQKTIFDEERLVEFARVITGDPERIESQDDDFVFSLVKKFGGAGNDRIIRERAIAFLLQVSGHIATDVKYLPDMLVDHLGLTDQLEVDDILQMLRSLQWNTGSKTWAMDVKCCHQALDYALEKQRDQTNQILDTIHAIILKDTALEEHLSRLPLRTSCEHVLAEVDKQGKSLYQKPHVHFQLEQQQVQQLLMGTQLYGDASLAIRELYQNALDACRYREALLKYIKAEDPTSTILDEWQPEIRFVQDVDQTGREYVECWDSGVGMGFKELSGCFAKAGRRFHDTPQFIEDQQRWRKHGIDLYPNSQFGVGVFSYFMLADEVEVTTARMDRRGEISKLIKTRVSSAGSLFRITEEEANDFQGTKIRLYLKSQFLSDWNKKGFSTYQTLGKLLWVAEFPTSVKERKKTMSWSPGHLNEELKRGKFFATPNPNCWLRQSYEKYQSNNIVLCDGIETNIRYKNFDSALVNLVGEEYPKLTVDRKFIASNEVVFPILERKVFEVTKNLKNLENIEWAWLYYLWSDSAKSAHVMCNRLEKENIEILFWQKFSKTLRVKFADIGFCKADISLLEIEDVNVELSDYTYTNEVRLKDRYGKREHWDFPTHLQLQRLRSWARLASSRNFKEEIEKNEYSRFVRSFKWLYRLDPVLFSSISHLEMATIHPGDVRVLDFLPKKFSARSQLRLAFQGQETLKDLRYRIQKYANLGYSYEDFTFSQKSKPQKFQWLLLNRRNELDFSGVVLYSLATNVSASETIEFLTNNFDNVERINDFSTEQSKLLESKDEALMLKKICNIQFAGSKTEHLYLDMPIKFAEVEASKDNVSNLLESMELDSFTSSLNKFHSVGLLNDESIKYLIKLTE